MPYPAKLTAETILKTALELLERGGPEALAMRPLADALGVRPSSLYRYYPERAALLRAMEAHATRELHGAIRDAVQGQTAADAFAGAAHAYLDYARAHPHLYALLLGPRAPYTAEPGPSKDLWNKVLAIVGAVTGNPDDTAATVAFWAYLHGFTLLERSGQFGISGSKGGFERGLQALVVGFQNRVSTP